MDWKPQPLKNAIEIHVLTLWPGARKKDSHKLVNVLKKTASSRRNERHTVAHSTRYARNKHQTTNAGETK
jgi:lipid A disaccharide synthetase